MRVEVDQSGKIDNTKVNTVLAFANTEQRTLLIRAEDKRRCVDFLKRRYRFQPNMRLFAAALFLLLRDHLHQIQQLVIDTEYTGQEGLIKGLLLDYIYRVIPDFDKERIVFRSIGRKSRAHERAWETYKGEIKPDRVVTDEELMALLRK